MIASVVRYLLTDHLALTAIGIGVLAVCMVLKVYILGGSDDDDDE